jgi:hypothetical protein
MGITVKRIADGLLVKSKQIIGNLIRGSKSLHFYLSTYNNNYKWIGR